MYGGRSGQQACEPRTLLAHRAFRLWLAGFFFAYGLFAALIAPYILLVADPLSASIQPHSSSRIHSHRSARACSFSLPSIQPELGFHNTAGDTPAGRTNVWRKEANHRHGHTLTATATPSHTQSAQHSTVLCTAPHSTPQPAHDDVAQRCSHSSHHHHANTSHASHVTPLLHSSVEPALHPSTRQLSSRAPLSPLRLPATLSPQLTSAASCTASAFQPSLRR